MLSLSFVAFIHFIGLILSRFGAEKVRRPKEKKRKAKKWKAAVKMAGRQTDGGAKGSCKSFPFQCCLFCLSVRLFRININSKIYHLVQRGATFESFQRKFFVWAIVFRYLYFCCHSNQFRNLKADDDLKICLGL